MVSPAISLRAATSLIAGCLAVHSLPAMAACDDVLPPASLAAGAARTITPEDLVRLRDIGHPDGAMIGQPSPLALSPDRNQAAFVISRGEPATNTYCRALVVIDLNGPANPRIVDRGGEMITQKGISRGLVYDFGFPAVTTPAWSPDGRSIAYQKRVDGSTQVWLARSDGSSAHVVTHSATDVVAVAWSPDGKRLVFVSNPGEAANAEEIAREERTGWLYDDRYSPVASSSPMVKGTPREAFSIAPDGSDLRAASAAQQALVPMIDQAGGPIPPSDVAPDGRRAFTQRGGPRPTSPLALEVENPDGTKITCAAKACDGGFTGVWWDRDGRTLTFLRREGWANDRMALYRWTPGSTAAPQRVLDTTGLLLGCLPSVRGLVCLSENSTTPRHIVLIDPHSGQTREVFDPNPEFRGLDLGTVEHLKWTNDRGLKARGDLVLPPGYKPGTRIPLIVVQYHSDGFLRGGTGDDYPIYPFAARGFAVLSTERTPFVGGLDPNVRNWMDVNAVNLKNWAERRSLLSSVETGVRMAIARGIADPRRIGITGLSDGSTTVRFALINSHMFAAAAISSCCLEPQSIGIYGGPAYAKSMKAMGYPIGPDPKFWQPLSMSLNAKRMNTPLLMQLSDDEYMAGLETYTALRNAGQPVEMYVFAGEHHNKWQPAHRLAVYQRSIDWFAFWLQHYEDPNPAKKAQYRRWEAMRDRLEKEKSG